MPVKLFGMVVPEGFGGGEGGSLDGVLDIVMRQGGVVGEDYIRLL